MSISAESSDAGRADESTSSASTLANGQVVTACQPEQRFDLDPADVVNPALRGTPEDGRLRVAFDALQAQLCDQFTYLPAEVQLDEPTINHGPRSTADGGDAPVNWSGVAVGAPERKFLGGVTARWVVPNIEARTPDTKEFLSCSIGLDDSSKTGRPGPACQAGIGSDVVQTGDTRTATFYPFVEWFPADQVKITNLPVGAGDSVFVTLRLDRDTQATATFVNETTFNATSVTFTAPPGTTLDGAGAAWIVAAPSVDGQPSTLPSHDDVVFTDCVAFVTAFQREKIRPRKGNADGFGQKGVGIDMRDDSGTVSQGAVLTDTVIRCRYVGPAAQGT